MLSSFERDSESPKEIVHAEKQKKHCRSEVGANEARDKVSFCRSLDSKIRRLHLGELIGIGSAVSAEKSFRGQVGRYREAPGGNSPGRNDVAGGGLFSWPFPRSEGELKDNDKRVSRKGSGEKTKEERAAWLVSVSPIPLSEGRRVPAVCLDLRRRRLSPARTLRLFRGSGSVKFP